MTCRTPKDEVLRWVGEKYIVRDSSASERLTCRKALNLMIDATKLDDDGIRLAAVQYGLCPSKCKTPRAWWAILDVAMKADDNGKTVERIAMSFGQFDDEYEYFTRLLAPWLNSPDKITQAKARYVRAVLDKTLAERVLQTR